VLQNLRPLPPGLANFLEKNKVDRQPATTTSRETLLRGVLSNMAGCVTEPAFRPERGGTESRVRGAPVGASIVGLDRWGFQDSVP